MPQSARFKNAQYLEARLCGFKPGFFEVVFVAHNARSDQCIIMRTVKTIGFMLLPGSGPGPLSQPGQVPDKARRAIDEKVLQ